MRGTPGAGKGQEMPVDLNDRFYAPKGEPDLLEHALDLLMKPPKFDHDLTQFHQLIGFPSPPRTREHAAEKILHICKMFILNSAAADNAPRAGTAINQLEETAQKCRELRGLLTELDPLTGWTIEQARDRYINAHPTLDADQLRSILRLLYPASMPPEERGKGNLLEILAALESIFVDSAETVRESLLPASSKGQDRGGQSNVFYKSMGHPKLILVDEAHTLFESYRPGEASPYDDGDFSKFCRDLFGFATNDDPNGDGAGLEGWIQDVTSRHRASRKPMDQYGSFRDEWVALTQQIQDASTDADREGLQARRSALEREAKEVMATIKSLHEEKGPIDALLRGPSSLRNSPPTPPPTTATTEPAE